jgi:hypothetical protein
MVSSSSIVFVKRSGFDKTAEVLSVQRRLRTVGSAIVASRARVDLRPRQPLL